MIMKLLLFSFLAWGCLGTAIAASSSSPEPVSVVADSGVSLPFIFLDGSEARLTGRGVTKRGGFVRDWTGTDSGPEWKLEVPATGTYYFWLMMASPEDQGGTAALFMDGREKSVWTIPSTGNFNDFQLVCMWSGELEKGEHEVLVKARELKGRFLMDVKYAVLSSSPVPDAWKQALAKEKKAVEDRILKPGKWSETFAAVCDVLRCPLSKKNVETAGRLMEKAFPHQMDWLKQDASKTVEELFSVPDMRALLADAVGVALKTVPDPENFAAEAARLERNDSSASVKEWVTLYDRVAYARRQMRLDRVRALAPKLIFAKHHVFGSISGIYLITETEGSNKKSALCSLDLTQDKDGAFACENMLVDPGKGSVRDPELSFDGTKLLFAMRASRKHFNSCLTYSHYAIYCPAPERDHYLENAYGCPESNYQIYELDRTTGRTRPLTTPETYGSSMEPCYLPNGDIMFSSSRIVQHITCGWGDLSNLFIMNKDGKYARRVGFDQTNTAFPSLLNDGRVIFTRRDYNDRGQSSAHALFQMNPDGTAQTEFYGNQTGLPNSFHHARAIPNSNKVICIIGGYHTTQGGKLALMDVSKGVELDQGIVEMPGYRTPKSGNGYDDRYGKQGEQFSNPYALTERDYLVSIAPYNGADYSLYYLNDKGERELLASDPGTSCLQVIPDAPRKRPGVRPSEVDYTKDEGIFYVQNVYYGEAAQGIEPGSVKKIRVIEMLYKNATIGTGRGVGPGGCWDTVMPTGHGLASFDSKKIIGDATVYEDGSAMFKAPARKPVYFQLLDCKNRVIQTMRSWATLMPAEKFSCVGCHEDKNKTPLNPLRRTIASMKPAEELEPFYGPPRAFSYIHEVQPVFDKHCIACHREGGEGKKLLLTSKPYVDDPAAMRRYYRSYFELTKARPENGHKPEEFAFWETDKVWGPRPLGKRLPDEPNKYVSWYTRFELMHQYPPYRAGAVRSGLVKLLEKGHKNVKLTQEEWDKICAWIDLNIPFAGEYDESNIWSDTEKAFYRARVNERARNEAIEARNIRELIRDGQS